MTKEEQRQLELDYDALNKKGELEKLRISKKDYINTTNEIRNMIIKYLLAQDIINYYNESKSKCEIEINKTEKNFIKETKPKKQNIFKKVLRRTNKNK